MLNFLAEQIKTPLIWSLKWWALHRWWTWLPVVQKMFTGVFFFNCKEFGLIQLLWSNFVDIDTCFCPFLFVEFGAMVLTTLPYSVLMVSPKSRKIRVQDRCTCSPLTQCLISWRNRASTCRCAYSFTMSPKREIEHHLVIAAGQNAIWSCSWWALHRWWTELPVAQKCSQVFFFV